MSDRLYYQYMHVQSEASRYCLTKHINYLYFSQVLMKLSNYFYSVMLLYVFNLSLLVHLLIFFSPPFAVGLRIYNYVFILIICC